MIEPKQVDLDEKIGLMVYSYIGVGFVEACFLIVKCLELLCFLGG